MISLDNIWLHCFIVLIIVIVLYIKNVPLSRPIFGIYRRKKPTLFYIKLCVMFILMKIRKRKTGQIEDFDRPQPLSEHKYAIDAVYFNGASEDKTILAVGFAKRKEGLVNGFFFLRIPTFNDNLLVAPKFPDTCLFQTQPEQDNDSVYKVDGITLTPLIPMRSWQIEYNGKMIIENDRDKIIDVKVDAVWTTNLPYFNYDVDIHPLTISRAIAYEPWSKEYFKNLENYHQTHYEQYGDVKGVATINGIEYKIHTNSVRDHSFGLMRDWKNFHRYAMHFFNLENGTRISVGVISIPITFSNIEVGFITSANKKNLSVSKCDLELWKHGEIGNPPGDYGFSFWAGCKRYNVIVKSYHRTEFYIGTVAECRIVEQFCEFEVNGVKGWGASEWQYRHVNGLPKLQ